MSNSGAADSVPDNYEAIEEAVMESPRGRWFLSEFAKRVRRDDTQSLIAAMAKLEKALAANQSVIIERLAALLAEAPPDQPKKAEPEPLAPQAMGFFARDEEIFELPPEIAAPSTARLVLKPPGEAHGAAEAKAEKPVPGEPEPLAHSTAAPIERAAAPVNSEQAKRRIVIIRHGPGEDVEVPLQEQPKASATG
jgi:hypothetical protein